jgi:hypothetical protein
VCGVDFVQTEQVRVLNKRPIFVTKCLNVLIEPAADIDSDHFAAEVLYDKAGVSNYMHTTSRHNECTDFVASLCVEMKAAHD